MSEVPLQPPHTKSSTIRTTSGSSALTRDAAPSRSRCPMAKAMHLFRESRVSSRVWRVIVSRVWLEKVETVKRVERVARMAREGGGGGCTARDASPPRAAPPQPWQRAPAAPQPAHNSTIQFDGSIRLIIRLLIRLFHSTVQFDYSIQTLIRLFKSTVQSEH